MVLLRGPLSVITLMILGLLISDSRQDDVLADDVTYYLYTRQNNESYTFLNSSNLDAIDSTIGIVFIIHGWTESRTTEWYEPLKNALLDVYDVNVIEVDYSPIAAMLYPIAVALADQVGNIIGDFIIDISNTQGISIDNFCLIGHSLGGQVVGFAGKRVISETGSQLKKITALDPAGPLFGDGYRLTPTDAEIVEVIHTDGGVFGYIGECGTVDFYPNGGTPVQPGCEDLITDIEALVGNGTTDLFFCSHHRSYWYYIEALQYGGFTGTLCSSYLLFESGLCTSNEQLQIGGDITLQDNGTYYLYTKEDYPYSVY